MNLRQLQYFRVVAEMKHYARAAQRFYVGQSCLSHAISNLEKELNVSLFKKKGRNIELTQDGELFLPYVEKALDVLERGVLRLSEQGEENSMNVTIAGSPSLTPFVSSVFVRYASDSDHAKVRFRFEHEVSEVALLECLRSGQIDMAFSSCIVAPEIASVLVGEHSLVLLVSDISDWAQRESVELQELEGESFIAYSEVSPMRKMVDNILQTHNVRPKITAEVAYDTIIYSLVSANYGVSITPQPLGGAPSHIKVIPIINKLSSKKLYLNWNRERRLSVEAVSFRDYIIRNGRIFDGFLYGSN